MFNKIIVFIFVLVAILTSKANSANVWICGDENTYVWCSDLTIQNILHRADSIQKDFLVRLDGIWYRITYRNNTDGQPTKEQSTLMALLMSAKINHSPVNIFYDSANNNEILRVVVE